MQVVIKFRDKCQVAKPVCVCIELSYLGRLTESAIVYKEFFKGTDLENPPVIIECMRPADDLEPDAVMMHMCAKKISCMAACM